MNTMKKSISDNLEIISQTNQSLSQKIIEDIYSSYEIYLQQKLKMEDKLFPEKTHLIIRKNIIYTGDCNDKISLIREEINNGKKTDDEYIHVPEYIHMCME